MSYERVVITGIGVISPLGQSLSAMLSAIREGRAAARLMEGWDAPALGLKTRVAAPVIDFVEQTIDRRLRRNMSRIAMLSTAASGQALQDAGLDEELLKSERTGVSYGSSFGGTSAMEDFFALAHQSGVLSHGIGSSTFLRIMPHTCATNIAIAYGIQGRIIASCVACASGTQAIGYAYEAIKYGTADRMLAGGAEELTPSVAAIFDVLGATSTRFSKDPASSARPFDQTRDGIVVGEGAGSFVLERRNLALERGAKIYGEIVGFHTNSDARHMTNPSLDGLVSCMRGALSSARIKPADVDYINAHAAGTAAGDRVESLAIEQLFGSETAVSSTKGHLGHLMGAAGALETAACIGMLNEQILYPTLNFEEAGPDEGRIAQVKGRPRPARLRTLLKNSFAFGGVNATLVIQEGGG